jgi:hypothetical protein
LAPLFAGQSPLFTAHDPELTLTGLHLIYQRLTATRGTHAGTV